MTVALKDLRKGDEISINAIVIGEVATSIKARLPSGNTIMIPTAEDVVSISKHAVSKGDCAQWATHSGNNSGWGVIVSIDDGFAWIKIYNGSQRATVRVEHLKRTALPEGYENG